MNLEELDHRAPPEYRVRATGTEEFVERVELHRRCWAPARIKTLLGLSLSGIEGESAYNLDKHRDVIASPSYRHELDVVVEAPDGSLCAYGLGWLDPVSHSLLFEPIGTDPNHSGIGLARAVCAQILRTAADLGATCAVVGPRGDEGYPVPRRVYEGLGMKGLTRHVEYSRGPETIKPRRSA